MKVNGDYSNIFNGNSKMILKLYLLFLFFENDNWDNKCNKKIILTLCNKKAPKNYITTYLLLKIINLMLLFLD